MIGCDLLLEYTAIVAVVAIGISGYFAFLLQSFDITMPAWMLGEPGTGEGHRVDLFAVVLCLLIAYLLSRGIRASARAETILVVVKVAIVLAVIIVGAFYVSRTTSAYGYRRSHLGQGIVVLTKVIYVLTKVIYATRHGVSLRKWATSSGFSTEGGTGLVRRSPRAQRYLDRRLETAPVRAVQLERIL